MRCNPYLQEKKREKTFANICIHDEKTGRATSNTRRLLWKYGMWGVHLNGEFHSIHWLQSQSNVRIELFTL